VKNFTTMHDVATLGCFLRLVAMEAQQDADQRMQENLPARVGRSGEEPTW
jgi:hypothetical protein